MSNPLRSLELRFVQQVKAAGLDVDAIPESAAIILPVFVDMIQQAAPVLACEHGGLRYLAAMFRAFADEAEAEELDSATH